MENILNRHRKLELRSICLNEAIGRKISLDPTIIESTKNEIIKLISEHKESSIYFLRWLEILNSPLDFIQSKLIEDGEEMAALRQSSPFAGILSPKERWEIYETFRT